MRILFILIAEVKYSILLNWLKFFFNYFLAIKKTKILIFWNLNDFFLLEANSLSRFISLRFLIPISLFYLWCYWELARLILLCLSPYSDLNYILIFLVMSSGTHWERIISWTPHERRCIGTSSVIVELGI